MPRGCSAERSKVDFLMGLLSFESEPLEWMDSKPYITYIKNHAIVQFINIYQQQQNRPGDCMKWGDEVESMIVRFDHEKRKVQLSLRGNYICHRLQQRTDNRKRITSFSPEYAKFVIEGMPGAPYCGSMKQYLAPETNLKMRRKEVQELLEVEEQFMCLTSFPRLGCFQFCHPPFKIESVNSNSVSRSIFIPDQAISDHPRYVYLTKNIRQRRGGKICINIPIFKDTNTPSPFIEHLRDAESTAASKPDHVYMDCMCFGCGCSCLQTTFQAYDLNEAIWLYDQMTPITPLMLALSAAAPIQKGYLVDTDVRWETFAHSVDDRRVEERGLGLHSNSHLPLRCGSTTRYLCESSDIFNDIELKMDEDVKSKLLHSGVGKMLSEYYAHQWVRDPLLIFPSALNDENTIECFENMQSTIWPPLRFKAPTDASTGWRVEFRTMEVQLTDFENAAYEVFVILLTRVILSFKLDFRLPVSLVKENMDKAEKNNAARNEKFYFRQNIFSSSGHEGSCCQKSSSAYQEMSLNSIFNGMTGVFPGLIYLIGQYLDCMDVDIQTRCRIAEYLDFLGKRASGHYLTTAQWIRQFVRTHPEYGNDSVVTDSITYDLLLTCDRIERGELKDHRLFDASRCCASGK